MLLDSDASELVGKCSVVVSLEAEFAVVVLYFDPLPSLKISPLSRSTLRKLLVEEPSGFDVTTLCSSPSKKLVSGTYIWNS